MIVKCSNCDTKYNLPEDKIAPGGSKVKCSKCGHMFKVEPPKAEEEEVETLLEEEAPAPESGPADAFDEEFGEALAQDAAEADIPADAEKAPEEDLFGDDDDLSLGETEGGVDAPPTDDFGDLFDDQEELEDAGEDEGLLAGDEGDLFEDAAGEEPEEESAEEDDGLGDLFEDVEEDEEDEDEEEGDDLLADDEGDEEDEEDEDEDDLFDGDLSLDEKPKKRGLGLIIGLAVVVLLGASLFLKPWTWIGLDLDGVFSNIPYIGALLSDNGMPDADPGESPEQKVNKIELKNVRQFYAKNEKAGILFVIQGTAVNNFPNPKERIKVQAELFDAKGMVVASDSLLCGNQLSMFQLQVQSRKEIEEGLKSEVGILSNNTFLRPGASTPFMFVFFEQPVNDIKEFVVKVVDAKNPE
mgnify:FL=1